AFCKKGGIALEASSPLGNGQILQNDVLKRIAVEKNKTVAQVCLRWAVQKDMVVIPKTVSPDRLVENIGLFDFELDEREMKAIDDIPYCGGIGIDPDEAVEFG
ncbi:MAG: aldo/keto reductase, partial [Lachnospiraceae bacterium]|nr:aldo/keto reductase [Lachnospiraceae bacterium]